MGISLKVCKKCMKISKGESEILIKRRTDKKNDKQTNNNRENTTEKTKD
jgi:hypothetical protein